MSDSEVLSLTSVDEERDDTFIHNLRVRWNEQLGYDIVRPEWRDRVRWHTDKYDRGPA
jgi:hypothetical protein